MRSPRVSKVWEAINQLCAIPLFALLMMVVVMFTCMYLLCGCDEHSKKEWFPPTQERVQHLVYVKDNRTGLCFIYNGVNNGHGFTEDVFTNVPCTPEVEKLISK